jgi:hypothetical protein
LKLELLTLNYKTMAFTDQERDIAKQIREQGGSREDFLDILQQVRTKQPAQPTEAVAVEETTVVEEPTGAVEATSE